MTWARSAARRVISSAWIVSVASGRCGPCCSRLAIGTMTMSFSSRYAWMSGGARSAMLYERRSTGFLLGPGRLLGADVLPQAIDRLLDVLVVELFGNRARPVVSQELLEPDARVRFRRVTDLPPLGYAAAVDRGDELDGEIAVVADVLERPHEQLPVDRALAGRHAVVVGDVEIDELVAGVSDRGGPIRFLDIHVEDVQADAAIASDVFGERERLIATVEEVRLEAVER